MYEEKEYKKGQFLKDFKGIKFDNFDTIKLEDNSINLIESISNELSKRVDEILIKWLKDYYGIEVDVTEMDQLKEISEMLKKDNIYLSTDYLNPMSLKIMKDKEIIYEEVI